MTKPYNINTQYYKNIPIKLIVRKDYPCMKAKRFILNNTNQNVWIPNKFLTNNGTLVDNVDLDWLFLKSHRQLEIAGIEFKIQ